MPLSARLCVLSALALAACTPGTGTLTKPDPTGPTDPTVPTTPTEPQLPDPVQVVINEVMPGNASTIELPSGERPDYVELMNTGAAPVPLSALRLRSSDGERWAGPADQTLEAGGRVLIWASETASEPLTTGFAIDKDGDKLSLLDEYDRVLDFVDFDAIDSDVAFARLPDGTGEHQLTAWPTPGEPNGDAPSPTLNPASETVFVPFVAHRLDFELDDQALRQIDRDNRPQVHAALVIDGLRYPDIALSLKGSASYQHMNGKPAFKVDLNEWVAGTKFRGLKALKLHNGVVLDPTRSRDFMSYGLARAAGLMAPRVGWADVYVNGEYYGIYILVEKHDDEFVDFHRPGQKDLGAVLEPNESETGGWAWGDFGQGSVAGWDYEEGQIPPDPNVVNALAAADALIASAPTDANVAELWNYFDREHTLDYLAWETLIMHTDGYHSPNNWRVFVDAETYKVELLPAGAEWTWDYDVEAWSWGGAVGSWCMRNDGCQREYAEHLLEMADLAESMDLPTLFDELQAWLDPYIDSDPRYNGAWDTVQGARQSTTRHVNDNPGRARRQVYNRFPDLEP